MDNRILNEIKQAKRLMEYRLGSNQTLNEELLEEGWKDWTIGLSLLMTSIVNAGKVEAQVQKIPDTKIDSTIASINNIIHDKTKLKQIADYLKTKGYNNQTNSIITHGQHVIKQIEHKRKSKNFNIDTVNTSDPKEMIKLLRSGKYALTSANIKTVIDTLYSHEEYIPTITINLQGNAEDFFDFGKLILKDTIKKSITNIINDINRERYNITKVIILSGTDSVRINPFGELKKMGINNNAELATARANVIKDYIKSFKIDPSLIQICTYPHNVENIEGFKPNPSLRIAGIQIEAINIIPAEKINKQTSINTTTGDFTLVGISGDSDESQTYTSIGKIEISKHKKKKKKTSIGKPIGCPKFGGRPLIWAD
jgi:hypothetical protein